jgi:hypothetical protein
VTTSLARRLRARQRVRELLPPEPQGVVPVIDTIQTRLADVTCVAGYLAKRNDDEGRLAWEAFARLLATTLKETRR